MSPIPQFRSALACQHDLSRQRLSGGAVGSGDLARCSTALTGKIELSCTLVLIYGDFLANFSGAFVLVRGNWTYKNDIHGSIFALATDQSYTLYGPMLYSESLLRQVSKFAHKAIRSYYRGI